MAHINRKQYWWIFVALFVLTVVEVLAAEIDASWGVVVSALVGLALVKAALVGWFYMHLNHDSFGMKLTIAIPMAMPFFYALVLIIESAYRTGMQ